MKQTKHNMQFEVMLTTQTFDYNKDFNSDVQLSDKQHLFSLAQFCLLYQ